MAVPLVALAATSETSYSQTNVLDDLKSSTVGGAPFDVKDYPYNAAKDAQIIHFVEYCYSYRENMQENYGLYIYVYNPKGQSFSENNKLNKIQMAVSYDADGNPTDVTEQDIQDFCLDLPRYKRPRRYIFADVPRNSTGKIDKPALRKRYGVANLVAEETTG